MHTLQTQTDRSNGQKNFHTMPDLGRICTLEGIIFVLEKERYTKGYVQGV